jgi:hypothetical protein
MARQLPIEIGALFAHADDARFVWRVEKFLTDDVHVVLVRVDDPTRRKTVSLWALRNARLFQRAPEGQP